MSKKIQEFIRVLLCLVGLPFLSLHSYSQADKFETHEEALKAWDHFLPQLFKQITVTGGEMGHMITTKHKRNNTVERLWFTLRLDPIFIVDPLYGVIESKKPEIGFEQLYIERNISVSSLYELQNKTYTFEPGAVMGYFTNSVDLVVLELEFHKIKGNEIDVTIQFAFSNCDYLYHCDIEEQVKQNMTVTTTLVLADCIYLDSKNRGEQDSLITLDLDPNVYNIKKREQLKYSAFMTSKKQVPYKVPVKYIYKYLVLPIDDKEEVTAQ